MTTFPVSGWRCVTPWLTSKAVISPKCLMAGKPPVSACSMLNGWPAVYWREGERVRVIVSLNADLCKANLWSTIGGDVSQVDASLSWDSSIERWRVGWFLPSAFCCVRLRKHFVEQRRLCDALDGQLGWLGKHLFVVKQRIVPGPYWWMGFIRPSFPVRGWGLERRKEHCHTRIYARNHKWALP